jgi:large subunit ribosomal protein L13
MSTTLAKQDEKKNWYIIDAEGQTLGRMAVKIANILRGRHKPIYTPHLDAGDYVIVINAEKVHLTGKKQENKEYKFYTGYRGNEYSLTLKDYQRKHPDMIIQKAVNGMLPKNKLARQMIKKLKIYTGQKHNHEAQNPTVLKIK